MKVFKKIIALLCVCVILFVINCSVVNTLYFDVAMFSSYNQKAEAADKIQGNKVLLIGGSATNLGFDSKHLSEKMGVPVVNMAISGGVPMSVYTKMAELHTNPGDIVICTPENSYWPSTFYTIDESYADMVCLNRKLSHVKNFSQHLKAGYIEFFRSFSRLNDVFNFALQEVLEGGSLYVADSVNEDGDFVLHKGKAPEYNRKDATEDVFILHPEMAEGLKDFIRRMEEKDVKVYISYPPQDGDRYLNKDEYFADMQKTVEETFGDEAVIGTPFDFLYDESWFFDTAYHLDYEKRTDFTEDFYNLYVANL